MCMGIDHHHYWYARQQNVVYGELSHNDILKLELRLKEHKNACSRGQLEKPFIADRAWRHDHHIEWEDTVVYRPGQQAQVAPCKGNAAHSSGIWEGKLQ